MNKSELQAKIAKMEKGLQNPNIQGAAREALEASLAKARQQLAATTPPPKSQPVPKKAAPTKATKASPQKATPAQTSKRTPVYSWRKKAQLAQLSPVTINCQHYHLKVDNPTKVSLKKSGKTSMVVTAQAGDHIIFDHQGYAVYIMEAASFARKCATATPNTSENASSSAKQAKGNAKPGVSKKKASATTRKKKTTDTKEKRSTKSKAPKADSSYLKTIKAFNTEVEKIRKNYKQPEADLAKVKQDLKALANKADQKNYVAFVERKIKRLQTDEVRATTAEITRIGIALRPLVQTLRGTFQDTTNNNRKVLEPTYENLIRWAKSPGQYDLAGVDAKAEQQPTTKAKVTKKEEKGFLEWVFG